MERNGTTLPLYLLLSTVSLLELTGKTPESIKKLNTTRNSLSTVAKNFHGQKKLLLYFFLSSAALVPQTTKWRRQETTNFCNILFLLAQYRNSFRWRPQGERKGVAPAEMFLG
jgi:hypothetical protein